MRYLTVLNRDLQIVYASGVPVNCRYSAEELIGKFPWEVVPLDELPRVHKHLKLLQYDRTQRLWVTRFVTSDKTFCHLCHAYWVGQADACVILVTNEYPADFLALTRRELEIMLALGRVRTPGEIASDLDLSRNTVETHIKRIRQKTGLTGIDAIRSFASQLSEKTGMIPSDKKETDLFQRDWS